jgi:hypothetical protein
LVKTWKKIFDFLAGIDKITVHNAKTIKKEGDFMSKNPTGPNIEQKRKHYRKAIVTSVSYKILTPSGDVGMTQNISEGGLCLLLNNDLLPGAILKVKFEIPDEASKSVESFVEVVWQKKADTGFLTGVKFI